MRIKAERKRNNYDMKHLGNFDLIYPSEDFKPLEFEKFLEAAHVVYEEFNNGG